MESTSLRDGKEMQVYSDNKGPLWSIACSTNWKLEEQTKSLILFLVYPKKMLRRKQGSPKVHIGNTVLTMHFCNLYH